jgi:hypothetical protein
LHSILEHLTGFSADNVNKDKVIDIPVANGKITKLLMKLIPKEFKKFLSSE